MTARLERPWVRLLALAAFATAAACTCRDAASNGVETFEASANPAVGGLTIGAPDEQGIDARPLIQLAERIRDSNVPIFSILISRDGVLVYELYTSSTTRDHAHYLMSVTKSFTSALMGAAMGPAPRRFAETTLFRPMGFRNYEWMHEDESGIDNGAYGLRLRPIDMQKFGVLFLHGGMWEGRRLLSKEWVDRSFSPWIKSSARLGVANYGWYWWTVDYAPHWLARVANGWKGQRIAVFPEKKVVVTMTAILEDKDEEVVFERVLHDYVIPSVDGVGSEPAHPDSSLRKPLAHLLEQVRQGPLRVPPGVESRMIPSVERKERHHPFSPR